MAFITQKAMPRRVFLRGAGAGLALPLLDAMVPAFAQTPAPTPRFGFVYIGNGVIHEDWKPTTMGRGFALPANLQPLTRVRQHMNVLTGLAQRQADGDDDGNHTRAAAAWLTGQHVRDRTQPGVEVGVATSADQLLARHIGVDTPVQSLELTVEIPEEGSCDAGDCFYVNTVSWRNETTPNMTELHPRAVFERLFGDGGSAAERLERLRNKSSLLDSVNTEARELARQLGAGDRSKIHEYLDTVRELEKRIQNTEARGGLEVELPERPTSIPETLEAHTALMFDLASLALRTDTTRVFTMILARELSGRNYAQIGVPGNHHSISHHRDDPKLMAQKSRIDTHNVSLFAPFIDKLAMTPDGDGSLLDHSFIVYGGAIGNGNLHRHTDIPCLTFGTLGGRIPTGQHIVYDDDTPMCNLLLTLLHHVGLDTPQFGDSTGRLSFEATQRG